MTSCYIGKIQLKTLNTLPLLMIQMNLGSYCNEKLRINTPKILVNSINPKKDHKN